jgi:hypothetical protein
MADEQSILCPHCGKAIALTQALTAGIGEKLRRQFEEREASNSKRQKEAYDRDLKDAVAQAARQAQEVAEWNAAHKVGTRVTVRRDSGAVMQTTTRSEALISSNWVKSQEEKA